MEVEGCVYVVRAIGTNYYKIGITISIDSRLSGLQATTPFWDLEFVTVHYCDEYRVVEKLLHQRYTDQRMRNSEWFELTSDDLTFLTMETSVLLDSLGIVEEALLPIITLHDLFPIQLDESETIEDTSYLEEIEVVDAELIELDVEEEAIVTLDELAMRLGQLYNEQKMKWREIADLPEYRGVPPGTLCAIMKGRNPKKHETRHILGLPILCPRCGLEIERSG